MHFLLIVSCLLFFYGLFGMILPLRIAAPWKFFLGLLIFLGAFKNQLFQYFGGGAFFAPEIPRWMLIAGSFLYSFLAVAFLFLILKDLCRIIFAVLKRPVPSEKSALLILFVSALLSACGTWEAIRLPHVREYSVELPGLGRDFSGTKIAVLADLHASALNRKELFENISRMTMEHHPDIILFAGDFVDGPVSLRKDDLKPLSRLSAPLGLFGVPGNHEYYSGYEEWMSQLRSFGITMLENQHALLKKGDSSLAIAGLTDRMGRRIGLPGPDFETAAANVPQGTPIILLEHRPDSARDRAAKGVSLMISGHTHGGMAPILKSLVARANGGFVSGWYSVGAMHLFNSPGTSLWCGFPFRLLNPSEISMITLHGSAR